MCHDAGEAVEPVVGRGEEHPRRGVRRARLEGHLAGLQVLAAAHGRAGGRGALDAQHGVAAPPDVHGVHLAARRGEALGAEHHHARGVETGPAAAPLAQPQPVGDPVPLGTALALVAAGEVQDLGEVVGRRAARPPGRRRRRCRERCWSRCAGPAGRRRRATRARSPAAAPRSRRWRSASAGRPSTVTSSVTKRVDQSAPVRVTPSPSLWSPNRCPRRCGRVKRPCACSPSSGIPGPFCTDGTGSSARPRPPSARPAQAGPHDDRQPTLLHGQLDAGPGLARGRKEHDGATPCRSVVRAARGRSGPPVPGAAGSALDGSRGETADEEPL